MKKVIRLTESDLLRLVKKVIKENKDMISIPSQYGGVSMRFGDSISPKDIIDAYNYYVEEGTSLVSYSDGFFLNEEDIDIPVNEVLDELNYSITGGEDEEDADDFFSVVDKDEVVDKKKETSNKSRIDKTIFNYLDGVGLVKTKKDDKIYFKKSEGDSVSLIVYDKEDEECRISWRVVNEISDFFSMDKTDSEEIIGRWVEKTLKKKVSIIRPLSSAQKRGGMWS